MTNNLNRPGYSRASSLISQGKINHGPWSFSAADGNKILGPNKDNWAEYSKHHLGTNSAFPQNSKEHYSYPILKNGQVYAKGVASAMGYSEQYNDSAINAACHTLSDKIKKKSGSDKRGNSAMIDKEEIHFVQKAPIEFEKTADGKLVVSGWSVHTGVFQGGTVEVPASELRNIAETLAGKQLRKDHSNSTDSVVGQVLETKVSLDKSIRKKGVRFKGVVRDPTLEQKITDGFINNNSIGFKLYPECSKCGEDFRQCRHYFDEARVIARDCDCYEQSFVPIGADGQTTIEPGASFSGEEDFKLQFEYKKPEDIEEMFTQNYAVAPPIDSITYNTNNSPPPIIVENSSADEEKFTLPPIQIIVNTNEDTRFSDTKEEDGENMEETKEFQDKISELEVEIATVTEERDTVAEELGTAKSELEDLQTEIKELKENKEASEAELQEYKDAEAAAVKMAKDTLCQEIAKLQVDKGVLEADKIDAKAEELAELDDKALDEMKTMLEAIKEETHEEPPVGEFHNQETGDKPMDEHDPEEIDLEDKEYRDAVFRKMLNIRSK